MNERFDKGLKLFAEIYGDDLANSLRDQADDPENFGSQIVPWTMEFPFGSIWTREEQMPRRMRSLVVLGMLIAQGATEEIKYHVRMGTANGLTRQDFEEIFYTTLPYCGFPLANNAKRAMLEALAEIDAGVPAKKA